MFKYILLVGAILLLSVSAVASNFYDSNQIIQRIYSLSDNTIAVSNTATSATSATQVSVSGSASSVTLLAANANRRGFVFFNNSTAIAYVTFGATSSTSAFTYRMLPNATLEQGNYKYTGVISVIWDSANGSMQGAELTP